MFFWSNEHVRYASSRSFGPAPRRRSLLAVFATTAGSSAFRQESDGGERYGDPVELRLVL